MTEKENRIRCLIIDDEPPAQRVLEKFISEIPFLQLEAKCLNVFEASTILHHQEIDLIFLDINMPKMTGIEFLRTLKNPPLIIITTAYSDYALEGYELNVTDYLQKPFGFERFFQAVNKVSANMHRQVLHADSSTAGKAQTRSDDFIFVREDKKNFKVNTPDILYLESTGDYVKVHTPNKTYLVYQTLLNFEKQLDPDRFIRIHKSFIIPFNRIELIEGNTVKIASQTVPVGVTFKKAFFEALQRFKTL
jgi:DNA-binding LytR/AlgR family response regulator